MDMICVVIDFFDSKSWVVFSDFVELLFYMFPYPFVRDNVTTVFGYQHYVIITEVDAVVGSHVFFLHVVILTRHSEWRVPLHPTGLRHGEFAWIKKTFTKV